MSYRGLGSENRFDEDISLDELAALVTLSRFHFCTAFRLATGRAGRPCRVPLDGICVSKGFILVVLVRRLNGKV
jgi:AraC-like DNA-binding protein